MQTKVSESRVVIIFDFDGTIAQTFDSAMKILDQLSVRFGHRGLKDEDIMQLRNEGKWEGLFESLGIDPAIIPEVVERGRSGLAEEIENIEPVEGMKRALLQLKADGYELGILTSNSRETVEKFLGNNGLDFFDFIYPEIGLWSKDKVLVKLLQDKELKPGQTVYVGDETRDIDAAKKAGVRVVAVSWGYNARKILKEQNPDYLVENPKDLVEILELINKS